MSPEIRPILRLAFPLIIGQLGQMLMGVVDTVMVAKIGIVDLAALTFACTLFYVPYVFGIGILTSVTVRTANARGSGDSITARASCRHGLYIGLALGMLLFLVAWAFSSHLAVFGQPAEVTAKTPRIFLILMASLIPALASMALKNHADALNRPWPPFWISLSAVLLNVLLNWLLIYGHLGFPKLGLEGAGWATFIARCGLALAMLIWLSRAKGIRDWVPHHWLRKPVMQDLRHLLVLGWPASLQMLSEVTAFSTAAIMVGHFGTISLAAHQVALCYAATAFMIPLGLSMALTVHIGEAQGAGNKARLRAIMLAGWGLAAGFAILMATGFLIFGRPLASLFVEEPGVVSLSASLLVVVGVFQIFDGLQVASSSMLRGLHDVRLPAMMGFASYWLVGLPCGALLAFGPLPGPRGIWWGLAIGLASAALTLCPRLWRLTRSS
jgi:multidrug resistance protein, MATE family